METIKKQDFVELKYTGTNEGKVFDSNIEVDLKKIDEKAKADPIFTIVGEGLLVSGFDNALEGKEVGKEYTVELKAKDAFGERRREMVKTIPLRVFAEQKVNPQPGMVFAMDTNLVKIIAVSGARVVADFNNPLAGKDVSYRFTIVRRIDDVKEKAKIFFEKFLRISPEFEVGEKVTVKGPKNMGMFIDAFKEHFNKLVGKDIVFEVVEDKKTDNKSEKKNPAHGEPGHVHEAEEKAN